MKTEKMITMLWPIFNRKEKWTVAFLFLLIFIAASLEVLGIGALLPFIALLSKPGLVESNVYLNKLYRMVDPGTANEFMIWLGFALIAIYIIKNIYMVLVVYTQSRFLNKKYLTLSARLFRSYLYSPYTFHLQRNTAQLLRNLQIINSIIQGIVWPALLIMTEATVMIIICIFLLTTNFISSIIMLTTLGISMFFFYSVVKRKLRLRGEVQKYHSGKTIQQIHQGIGSIKETKVLGREKYFDDLYTFHFKEVAYSSHYQQIISQLPRYYIETVSVTLVLLIMIFLLYRGDSMQSILMTLSVFALAAVRLMPGLVRISKSIGTIRFYIPSLEEVYADLVKCEKSYNPSLGARKYPAKAKQCRIEFSDVSFRYENAEKDALTNVSLKIAPKKMVGFVGPSGAGKTTIVDVLLGLLSPEKGKVLVDGLDISTGISEWQKRIGYVPQEIYLTDDTIRSNVALALPPSEINDERVWEVLKTAQLDQFVRDLPEGINTLIGEKGARLSGGERQRVGIARALYYDPDVLVLDEATAALDNETEQMFMRSLKNIRGQKTLILIAHRLTTVSSCDEIFFLENGFLRASGKYDELIEKCPEFARMAKNG